MIQHDAFDATEERHVRELRRLLPLLDSLNRAPQARALRWALELLGDFEPEVYRCPSR